METIENRPIPGLTAKTLSWLIGSVITIVVTVMMAAFSIKADVQANNREMMLTNKSIENLEQQGKTRDANMETIKTQIQALQLQIALIEQKLKDKQ